LHTPNCIPPSRHQFKCAAASPDPSTQPPLPQPPLLLPSPSPPPQPLPLPLPSSSPLHCRRCLRRHIFFILFIVVCAPCRRCCSRCLRRCRCSCHNRRCCRHRHRRPCRPLFRCNCHHCHPRPHRHYCRSAYSDPPLSLPLVCEKTLGRQYFYCRNFDVAGGRVCKCATLHLLSACRNKPN
jgi:hypothetical protein